MCRQPHVPLTAYAESSRAGRGEHHPSQKRRAVQGSRIDYLVGSIKYVSEGLGEQLAEEAYCPHRHILLHRERADHQRVAVGTVATVLPEAAAVQTYQRQAGLSELGQ